MPDSPATLPLSRRRGARWAAMAAAVALLSVAALLGALAVTPPSVVTAA